MKQRENATLKVQKEFAANATFQLNPGEPLPSETSSTKPSQSSTPGSGSGSDSHSHGSSLSAGAIAGIAIGGAAVLILAGALLYLCGRRERLDSFMHRHNRNSYAVPPTTENKYDPRSPGQETFHSQSHYSVRDPYGPGPHSPPLHSHYAGTPPPPMSPGHPGYDPHHGMAQSMASGQTGHGGY